MQRTLRYAMIKYLSNYAIIIIYTNEQLRDIICSFVKFTVFNLIPIVLNKPLVIDILFTFIQFPTETQ